MITKDDIVDIFNTLLDKRLPQAMKGQSSSKSQITSDYVSGNPKTIRPTEATGGSKSKKVIFPFGITSPSANQEIAEISIGEESVVLGAFGDFGTTGLVEYATTTKNLTSGVSASIFEVLPSVLRAIGFSMQYSVLCADATDVQIHLGHVWGLVTRVTGGVTTTSYPTDVRTAISFATGGTTLTRTSMTATDTSTKATIKVNFTTSLSSPTVFVFSYSLFVASLPSAITINIL